MAKRGRKGGGNLSLEKVLGLTTNSNAGLAVRPGSSEVAYAAGCVVVIYDWRRNKQVRFVKARHPITCVTFSSSGRFLAASGKGQAPAVLVWDLDSNGKVAELKEHKLGVATLAFSPDERLLVSAGVRHDRFIHVWDWQAGRRLACNKAGTQIYSLAWSPDSSYFVTCGERHVKYWSVADLDSDSSAVAVLDGRSGIMAGHKTSTFVDVACGVADSLGRLFALTADGVLCCFGSSRLLEKWVELEVEAAHALAVTGDCVAVACSNGVVRMFEPDSLNYITTLPRPPPLGKANEAAAAFEEDAAYAAALAVQVVENKLIAVYSDRSLFIWDVSNPDSVGKTRSFLFHDACIYDIKLLPPIGPFPPDTFATASADNSIRLWNLGGPGDAPHAKSPFSRELLHVLYLAGFAEHHPVRGEFNPEAPPARMHGEAALSCLAAHSSGRMLAAGDKMGNLRVFDLDALSLVGFQVAHDAELTSLHFSPRDPLLASASRDGLIHIFDIRRGFALRQTLDEHDAAVTCLRFSNDGHRLVSCGADESVLLLDVKDDCSIMRYRTVSSSSTGVVYDMDVDASSRYMLTAGRGRKIAIRNLAEGKFVRAYSPPGKRAGMNTICLDPAGTTFVTSTFDKWIKLFDFYSGDCLAKVRGHEELVTGLQFTHDCRRLISVSGDGCIFVWRLSPTLTRAMLDRRSELDGEEMADGAGEAARAEGTDADGDATAAAAAAAVDAAVDAAAGGDDGDGHAAAAALAAAAAATDEALAAVERPPTPPPALATPRDDTAAREAALHSLLDDTLASVPDDAAVPPPTAGASPRAAAAGLLPKMSAALPAWAKSSAGMMVAKEVKAMASPRGAPDEGAGDAAPPAAVASRWAERVGGDGYKLFGELSVPRPASGWKDTAVESVDGSVVIDDDSLDDVDAVLAVADSAAGSGGGSSGGDSGDGGVSDGAAIATASVELLGELEEEDDVVLGEDEGSALDIDDENTYYYAEGGDPLVRSLSVTKTKPKLEVEIDADEERGGARSPLLLARLEEAGVSAEEIVILRSAGYSTVQQVGIATVPELQMAGLSRKSCAHVQQLARALLPLDSPASSAEAHMLHEDALESELESLAEPAVAPPRDPMRVSLSSSFFRRKSSIDGGAAPAAGGAGEDEHAAAMAAAAASVASTSDADDAGGDEGTRPPPLPRPASRRLRERTLEQERSALRLKEKHKDTNEAVARMRERLRSMRILGEEEDRAEVPVAPVGAVGAVSVGPDAPYSEPKSHTAAGQAASSDGLAFEDDDEVVMEDEAAAAAAAASVADVSLTLDDDAGVGSDVDDDGPQLGSPTVASPPPLSMTSSPLRPKHGLFATEADDSVAAGGLLRAEATMEDYQQSLDDLQSALSRSLQLFDSLSRASAAAVAAGARGGRPGEQPELLTMVSDYQSRFMAMQRDLQLAVTRSSMVLPLAARAGGAGGAVGGLGEESSMMSMRSAWGDESMAASVVSAPGVASLLERYSDMLVTAVADKLASRSADAER